MTKHTSALILPFVVILSLSIYGCCSHHNGGVLVYQNGDTVIEQRAVTINSVGQLGYTVFFPSGAKVESLEQNTLTHGIKVTLVEQKLISQNTNDVITDFANDELNLYKITAVQEPSNLVESKTDVTTMEKPFKVTLPTNNTQGLGYIGIRESNTDPWRFMRLSEQNDNLTNITTARASSENLPPECSFNLHRLGTSFCLVIYNGIYGNRLPETVVDSLIASSSSILVKDGKYEEDLDMKAILKGVKLDSINPTDLRARITYRNNKADNAPIKVNGSNITQISKADKTVPGYTYYHSFLVDSVSDYSLNGTNGEYCFTLNLNGIELDSFPTGFLIEFYNKINSEKILPYNYTEFFRFETKEKQEESEPQPQPQPTETYSITYNLDGGQTTEDNPTSYDTSFATFTLINPTKEGYTFVGWSGTEIEGIASDVTIIGGSTGDREYTAHWSENPPNTFTFVINKGDGIATVTGAGAYKAGVEVAASYTLLAGYEFFCWSGDFTTEIFTMPAKDVTMTANAKPIVYNISYNLNNGQPTADNPTTYDVTSATITLYNPQKDGYAFVGWTGSNGDTPETTVKIEAGSTGEKSYIANYTAIDYVITYNLGANNVVNNNPTGYNTASETFTITEPTREGYTFAGWTGTDLNAPSITLTIPKGSIGNKEYTANWAINSYMLTLNKGTGINTVINDGLHEYNSEVIASCTMLAGYEFDSWTGDFTTGTFTMPADNATMTANAKLIVYNINYNLADGVLDEGVSNPTKYDVTSATINLNKPKREGYSFVGWSGTEINGIASNVAIISGSTGPREYTANWSINTYRLDLIAGSHVVNVTGAGYYQYGANVEVGCTFNLGYELDSWTGDITTGTFNMPAQNATMTANAKLKNYTITYELDGGTLAEGDSNPEYYNVTSATITLKNPTKPGTYFMGWSCDDFYGASMSVKIPQGSVGNKFYWANWGEVLTFTLANNVKLEMHLIPAGSFERYENGSNYGTKQIVTISEPFYIGKFELTQDQYFAVMGTNPSSFKGGSQANERPTTTAGYPLENVNWNNFNDGNNGFLAKLNEQLMEEIYGYRFVLPTEAQWEYACRAGTNSDYNNGTNQTGNTPDTNLNVLAWYTSNSNNENHGVGSLTPNAWGLYDMHGNVWEWCSDLYDTYPTGDLIDPYGYGNNPNPVRRGGGRSSNPGAVCSWARNHDTQFVQTDMYGFRLALIYEGGGE